MKALLKTTFILFVAVAGMLITTACSSDDPEPAPSPAGPPHRTLIIYMAADNNLSTYALQNMRDIRTAVGNGALQGGRILLYHDSPSDLPYLAEITEDADDFVKLKEYDESVSCLDAERMRTILNDAQTIAPAEEYGLILWSHGTGWMSESDSRSRTEADRELLLEPYSFGQDLHPESQRMSVSTLGEALRGMKFKFIYFDCCFMSTVEAIYELRDVAEYIYGSPTELPVEGMPYLTNIPAMMSKTLNLEQIAENTLEYYLSGKASVPYCTITLVETQYMDELARATKAIMATGAVNTENYSPIAYFRPAVKSYMWDMKDMIDHLPTDGSLIKAWDNAFDRAVRYYGHTDISYYMPMEGTNGIGSFYYSPSTAYLIDTYKYTDLEWWRDVVSHNPTINP